MPRETSNAPSSATDDGGLPFRATTAEPVNDNGTLYGIN